MGVIFCIRCSLVEQPVSADRRHDTATVSRNVNWCSRQDDSCVSGWVGECVCVCVCVCGWVGESEWMSWWVSEWVKEWVSWWVSEWVSWWVTGLVNG